MFGKILIANRGEIACRVMRTARRLGLATVAVYSDADRDARHVAEADEAYRLGPAPAAESYLRGDAIIAAAKRAGAEAIHPGYGFLSENADFAAACEAAGLVFVGPPPDAIRAMGRKDEAKRIMEQAGVPVVPGYHGAEQNPDTLAAQAAKIGYPVLIKPVAGGGGKGMRRVEGAGDFAEALAGAKREAASSFGDEAVLIEKFVAAPRHIEFQVFADSQGNALHLFERDCSLQRRHQKVVEEAPAPGMDDGLRAAVGAAAVAAAKAIGYRGAGTVEFIADGSQGLHAEGFYFMEMNTRLQVEHPVTEMVTGQDLVEWQLRVAAGEPLPAGQADLNLSGHAVELRLYAEDPARDFLPASGPVKHLVWPPEDAGLRIDAGVRAGDQVSPHYDPMIAKIIAWGADRETALARASRALKACELEGCRTNLAFLGAVLGHPGFRAGGVDTGFLSRHGAELLDQGEAPGEALLFAALYQLLPAGAPADAKASAAPWDRLPGWRLWGGARQFVHLESDGKVVEVPALFRRDGGLELELPAGTCAARVLARDGARIICDLGDRRLAASVVGEPGQVTVFMDGAVHRFRLPDQLIGEEEALVGDDRLVAPLPGQVSLLKAAAGETVSQGQVLVVVEAMKMEHSLVAPRDGVVSALYCAQGDQVEEGAVLLLIGDADEVA